MSEVFLPNLHVPEAAAGLVQSAFFVVMGKTYMSRKRETVSYRLLKMARPILDKRKGGRDVRQALFSLTKAIHMLDRRIRLYLD